MSRAFVKETAESAPPPERMVEDGPNPVTPEGMAQIEAHVARIEAALQDRKPMSCCAKHWRATCATGPSRKATAEDRATLHRRHGGIRLDRHHRSQGPEADIPHCRRGRSRRRQRHDQLSLTAGAMPCWVRERARSSRRRSHLERPSYYWLKPNVAGTALRRNCFYECCPQMMPYKFFIVCYLTV